MVKAAAETFGWDRGHHRARGGSGPVSRAAVSAILPQPDRRRADVEVEVNRQTGRVRVKRMVCAHDWAPPSILKGAANGRERCCTLEPGAARRGAVRHREDDGRRLDSSHASAHRHPGEIEVVMVNGDPIRTGRTSLTTGQARRSVSRCSRPSRTPSSTRLASACGACRSGPRMLAALKSAQL